VRPETHFDLPEPPSARKTPPLDATFFDLPEPVSASAPRPGDRADLAALLGFADAMLPAPVPSIAMPEHDAPILMDVTPLSLGIETVGGYTERVIRQNSPVPIEQTRMFTTAQDGQETVRVAVCQGESRVFSENQPLGELELTGIRAARRGVVKIQVTFMLDADGLLDVDARDEESGQRQSIRIRLVGGHGDDELEEMRARQEQLAPTE
jgi:molecular chaperone DnaK